MALVNVHFVQFCINCVQFLGGQADLQCAEVFRQTVFFGRPRNRHDEIPLRQFPRQYDLRGGGRFGGGKLVQLHKGRLKTIFPDGLLSVEMVPEKGIEPPTFALRMRCSTD